MASRPPRRMERAREYRRKYRRRPENRDALRAYNRSHKRLRRRGDEASHRRLAHDRLHRALAHADLARRLLERVSGFPQRLNPQSVHHADHPPFSSEGAAPVQLATERQPYPEPVPDVARILGKEVAGVCGTDRPSLVHAPHPRRDGGRGQQKHPSRLLQRPAPRGPELEDAQALGRRVVGPPTSGDPRHAGVLDANLLTELRDLLVTPPQFRLESHTGIDVLRGPAASGAAGVPSA